MTKPVLIVMAAGMGSRYGGLKQVDKVTDAGEIILDFSLYDAMLAGFDKVIFVIREEHREIFREMIDERAGKHLQIQYAYQSKDHVPEGFRVPEGREKPWGTAHAILECKDLVDGPFAVINADDYYGPEGFAKVYDYLSEHPDGDVYEYCMVGYKLKNTITENGHVSRGVCETDDEGYLKKVVERTRIKRIDEGIAYTEDEENWTLLDEDATVSMNFWGYNRSMMDEIEKGFVPFMEKALKENPIKGEYPIPTVTDELIQAGKARVKVLETEDKWCGVTYQEDKESVKAQLQSKKDKGEYPEKLWK